MEGLEPPRDLVLETSALPIELHTCIFFEVSIGIEPIYQDFADLDLTSRTTDLICSEDGGRTRDLEVMTLTLSRLSYLAK